MFSNWIKLRMELMQSNCNVILIIDLQGKSHPEEYYVNVICDPHVTVMNSCAEFNHHLGENHHPSTSWSHQLRWRLPCCGDPRDAVFIQSPIKFSHCEAAPVSLWVCGLTRCPVIYSLLWAVLRWHTVSRPHRPRDLGRDIDSWILVHELLPVDQVCCSDEQHLQLVIHHPLLQQWEKESSSWSHPSVIWRHTGHLRSCGVSSIA